MHPADTGRSAHRRLQQRLEYILQRRTPSPAERSQPQFIFGGKSDRCDVRPRIIAGRFRRPAISGSVATFGVGSRVICERAQFTSQAATRNSPAMNVARVRMSLPPMFRTCPFLIIAISSYNWLLVSEGGRI
jgi:hypothetical protein